MKSDNLKPAIFIYILTLISNPLFSRIPTESNIISQENCPIQITEYESNHKSSIKYGSEGIRHFVKYKNTSDSIITALEFGFVSFNIWNEFLHKGGGYTIEDIQPMIKYKWSYEGTWIFRCYGEGSFQTGYVYVSKVRFRNNTFWKADENQIINELRKIEDNFQAENLIEKKQ